MLRDLKKSLPERKHVYVLCDGWFSSAHLFKIIKHQLHWDFIMVSKGNRKLGRYALNQWWRHLGHQPIRRVRIDSTKGRRVFLTRNLIRRLPGFDGDVTAVLSKWGRRRQPFVYLLCSDTALAPDTILRHYVSTPSKPPSAGWLWSSPPTPWCAHKQPIPGLTIPICRLCHPLTWCSNNKPSNCVSW